MLIPKFWAEARLQHRTKNPRRQLTLRRSGWSDVSQEDAQRHAQERVEHALQEALASDTPQSVRKVDHKVPYNGAEGLPIREEIIDQQTRGVITRNSYGALCLNVPDALFVDIDNDILHALPKGSAKMAFVAAFLGAVAWKITSPEPVSNSLLLDVILGTLGLWIVLYLGAGLLRSQWIQWRGGTIGWVCRALEKECSRERLSSWQVYETPQGVRVMGLHAPFDPSAQSTQDLMKRLGVDPMYALMCARQNCFRARVSAKPWRMKDMERMRGPVWPVQGEALDKRNAWVAQYNAKKNAYSACYAVMRVGTPLGDPRIEALKAWHDSLSGAYSQKPLA